MRIETVFSRPYGLNNADRKIVSPEVARKELFEKLGKYESGVVRKNSSWKRITLDKDIYYTTVFIYFESKAFNLLNGGGGCSCSCSCSGSGSRGNFTLNNVFSAAASDFMELVLNGTHISNAMEFLDAVGEKLEEVEQYQMAAEFKLGVKSAKKFFKVN